MKMTKTILMLILPILSLLYCCVGAEIIPTDDSNKVSILQGPVTRAANNAWEVGDKIGVTMYNKTKTSYIRSYSNYAYVVSSAGESSSFSEVTGAMYYPNDDVILVYWYPYSSSNSTTIPIDLFSNPCELYRGQTNWTFGSVKTILPSFKHVLGKIKVKLVAGTYTGDLSNFSGTLKYIAPMGSYNVETEAISLNTYAATSCSFIYIGDNTYETLVIPQSLVSTLFTFSKSTESISFDYKLTTASIGTEELIITLTVNQANVVVSSSEIVKRGAKTESGSADIYS